MHAVHRYDLAALTLEHVPLQWPTFPQVYINGEFYGGCDIMIGATFSAVVLPLLTWSSYHLQTNAYCDAVQRATNLGHWSRRLRQP